VLTHTIPEHTSLPQSDAAGVIESRILQVRATAEALQAATRTHRNNLGPDARHWLHDLDQQLESLRAYLDMMFCSGEHCTRLGVYLHPDARFERYCAEHLTRIRP